MLNKFVTEALYPLEIVEKKMFGNTAFYLGKKILLATRENKKKPIDNGIWIGTSLKHHESLKNQFASFKQLKAFNVKKWLLLPIDAPDFEEVVVKICGLIKAGDERIGVEVKNRY